MRYIKQLLASFIAWLWPRRHFRYRFAEEVPEQVRPGHIFLVGTPDDPWVAVLQCPCGCGRTIKLNLLKEASPCWSFTARGGRITLKPSIWGTSGCRSHFFIRNGRIEWAGAAQS
jgi:hypothetical protein